MLYVFSSIKIHTRTLQHFIVVASVAEVCARQGLIVIWSLLLLFCLFFLYLLAILPIVVGEKICLKFA